mgnify:CR=1 FL=1
MGMPQGNLAIRYLHLQGWVDAAHKRKVPGGHYHPQYFIKEKLYPKYLYKNIRERSARGFPEAGKAWEKLAKGWGGLARHPRISGKMVGERPGKGSGKGLRKVFWMHIWPHVHVVACPRNVRERFAEGQRIFFVDELL